MVSSVAGMNVRFSGGMREAEGMNGEMGDRGPGRGEGCVGWWDVFIGINLV